MKEIYAIRAAVCVENDRESICRNIEALFAAIIAKNSLDPKDVISVQFTVTGDITAFNPATALRQSGMLPGAPLFCACEPNFDGSLALTVRALVTCRLDSPPHHVYCNGAQALRPDLQED